MTWKVRADVVDISDDMPRSSDVFLVDTCAWREYTRPYSRYRKHAYPNYLDRVSTCGSRILRCELSLSELTHTIRNFHLRKERQKSGKDTLQLKDFLLEIDGNYRHKINDEIRGAWDQVCELSESASVTIDTSYGKEALKLITRYCFDGYDSFIIQISQNQSATGIITNDKDFAVVEGICVFTANKTVLNEARACGKLVKR